MEKNAAQRTVRREVVLVHSGENPPDEYDASVLVDAADAETDELVAALSSRWRGDGVLVLFLTAGTSRTSRTQDWRVYWGDRADVVLSWDSDGTARDAIDRWKDSGRLVRGANGEHPAWGPGNDSGISTVRSPLDAVNLTLDHLGGGARRVGAYRHVPLILWRTPSFQAWLTSQEAANNEFRGGRLLWLYRIGKNRDIVFFWAFEANMWIAVEQRENIAEVVLCRPNISSVVAYRPAKNIADTEVIIVREFRSPSVSADGFVRELPGGSSYTPSSTTIEQVSVLEQAMTEFYEETGILLDSDRFQVHQTRQLAATVSAHQQDVIAVELTDDELEQARSDTRVHGVLADSERTYVEVHRYADLIQQQLVDWTTLGAISSVLFAAHAIAA